MGTSSIYTITTATTTFPKLVVSLHHASACKHMGLQNSNRGTTPHNDGTWEPNNISSTVPPSGHIAVMDCISRTAGLQHVHRAYTEALLPRQCFQQTPQ